MALAEREDASQAAMTVAATRVKLKGRVGDGAHHDATRNSMGSDPLLQARDVFRPVSNALDAPETERERVTRLATRRLRPISIGRHHWLD